MTKQTTTLTRSDFAEKPNLDLIYHQCNGCGKLTGEGFDPVESCYLCRKCREFGYSDEYPTD